MSGDFLRVLNISVEPEPCPFGADISITCDYILEFPVSNVSWIITFVHDISGAQTAFELGTAFTAESLPSGQHSFSFRGHTQPLADLGLSHNMSLLKLSLFSGDDEVASINGLAALRESEGQEFLDLLFTTE